MNAFSLAIVICAIVFMQAPASAQRAGDEEPKWKIEPVVLDGSNSTGATLGVQWSFKDQRHVDIEDGNGNVRGKLPTTERTFDLGYSVTGTAAADSERNPKNFIEALVDVGASRIERKWGVVGAAFAKFETDQALDNKQYVYGLRGTGLKTDILRELIGKSARGDYVIADLNFGQVDPKKDKDREAVLGTTNLEKYYRWDLDFVYKYHLVLQQLRNVEFNFRYFRENGAPEAVKTAHLDRHQLTSLRFGLQNDLFVAYSRGKLPFDRTSDRILELGWSAKLK